MDTYSFINSSDPQVIENLYQEFKNNPEAVDPAWRRFFEGFDFAAKSYRPAPVQQQVTPSEFKVLNLIDDYRKRGHLFTKTNPVRKRRTYSPTLDIENFGLTKKDLDSVFQAGNEVGLGAASLRTIISTLEDTYCRSFGAEFMFIRNLELVDWLIKRMEPIRNRPVYTAEDKRFILQKLDRAVNFEKFSHTRFPGQKRFSLEGGDSLIPGLEALLEKSAEMGAKELVIGMAHRGRLNVLANILRKPYQDIFNEFEGKEFEDETLLGDVKYHMGHTIERKATNGQTIKLTLSPNPSHLETVDPVVEGISRAKVDLEYEGDFSKVTPVLIHGDASLAGQGIIYEVAQMSELKGYKTGGTIHIVINNQVGFTTDYLDARSSIYCTDIAKVTQSPVFHVNGDDPEAVVYAMEMAVEIRNKFNKDVYVDLLCYRKYGHNEGDEPRFTQPLLYKIIETHPNPRDIYAKQLIAEGVITQQEVDEQERQHMEKMEESLLIAKKLEKTQLSNFAYETWKGIRKANKDDFLSSPKTGFDRKKLDEIAEKLTKLPDALSFFRKTVSLQEQRRKMYFEKHQVDWAMGELLAYGSLLIEKHPVRLSGQDVGRGTFSHRHAVLRVENSEKEYVPLNNLDDNQARFDVYNSLLSEYGVLGFEYGYSLASPYTLTIWEAQFGDFNNGAQIIFDQFISSAEEKWNVMNDLVVLLPHGYEGQGPEHSSARIERFLTLCAENNMQVANCTTPANFYHILRRQLNREFRKPLVIFTPKSLLRHPKCVSSVDELVGGKFLELIDDANADVNKVKSLIFCSGKVYYDLLEEQEKLGKDDTAIIRIEQLYPLPAEQMRELIAKYINAKTYLWVQEEPLNMGAYHFIEHAFKDVKFRMIARPASGSPSTGSSKFHVIRQQKILDKAFHACDCPLVDEDCGMICIGNRWKSFEKELKELKVDMIDSKFHNAIRKLDVNKD